MLSPMHLQMQDKYLRIPYKPSLRHVVLLGKCFLLVVTVRLTLGSTNKCWREFINEINKSNITGDVIYI